MGEFRIGRKFASHSYPDPPRGGIASSLARNSADGPATETDVSTGGTLIEWANIGSGDAATTDVPITPAVTGIVRIAAVLCFKSSSDINVNITITIQIDGVGVPVPSAEVSTIAAGGALAIPVLLDTDALSLGAHTVSILATAAQDGVITMTGGSSTLDLQETTLPTG